MKRKLLRLFIGSGFLVASPALLALPSFVSQVPNGATFSCSTCHTTAPAFNQFGAAFFNNGEVWNAALATGDADGDTFSNGTELGDPTGAWRPGTANPPGPVFNPGDANSHPTAATAPSITTQPASQTVTAGANVTFTVVASGTAPLSYQWRKGGTAISGATTTALTLNSVTTGDAGTYSVVVTNTAGSVTSSGAVLTVNAAAVPPSITTQPASQTVTAGANVIFTVVASGTAPLTYQWRKDGTPISGATGTALSLPSVTTAAAGTYSVVVTNIAGMIASAGAVLTVNPAVTGPAITTQPASQTVVAGANVTFTVAASGTPPLSYQWRKNGTAITGATTTALTLNSVTTTDAATYSVVVTNTAGSVTSSGATLTVNPAIVAPTITTQPASQTVTAGANVTFTVAASGTSPLSYQWRKNGTPLTGATATALTLNSVTTSDAGTYSVVVTNAAGSATSAGATLTVNPAVVPISVVITSPTNGATFTAPAFFSLTATAGPAANIAKVEFFQGATSLGSLTAPPFTFPVANLGAGVYTFTARATSTSGAVSNSPPVMVTVTTGPGTTGPATVTVTAPDPNASEPGLDPGTFRIARTGPTTNALMVFFLLGGTAVNGQDYQPVTNFVTIATGSATADVTITPIADSDSPPEISDAVVLQLVPAPSGFPGYAIGTPSNAVVTIMEPPSQGGNQPPVVRIVAPRNGATFRSGSNILLAAQASDPDGSVVKVEFFAGTRSLGVATAIRSGGDDDHEGSTGNLFVLNWRNAPAGQFVLTAVATDNQGATTISDPVTITVRSGRRPGGDGDGRSGGVSADHDSD